MYEFLVKVTDVQSIVLLFAEAPAKSTQCCLYHVDLDRSGHRSSKIFTFISHSFGRLDHLFHTDWVALKNSEERQ